MFTALVLAGDRGAGEAENFGGRKALLQLAGKPMICHVLAAVKGAAGTGDIYIIANDVQDIEQGLVRASEDVRRIRFLEGENTPVKSIIKILKTLKPTYPVLVCTADNPLLSAATIDDFCNAAEKMRDADIAVALAEKSKLEAIFPNASRSFVNLKGDGYKGCNLFAVFGPGALPAMRFWLEVERDRKKAWKLVSAFGLGMLLRVLFRRITLDEALSRASTVMGARVKPVLVEDVKIAIDVDRKAHLDIVAPLLGERDG